MRKAIARFICPMAFCACLLAAPAPAHALLGGLFGSPVDAELAAKVPQDKRAAINAADYALAQLKEELADRQDDLANLGTKLAKAQLRAAEIALDIAKMEAILANKLGQDADNRKVLAGLTTDRAKNETDRQELSAKIYQATLFVRDWTQRVADKEKTVSAFKARRPAAGAALSPVLKPAPAQAPKEDPVEIINPEPGSDQAKPAAPAAAEADLKN